MVRAPIWNTCSRSNMTAYTNEPLHRAARRSLSLRMFRTQPRSRIRLSPGHAHRCCISLPGTSVGLSGVQGDCNDRRRSCGVTITRCPGERCQRVRNDSNITGDGTPMIGENLRQLLRSHRVSYRLTTFTRFIHDIVDLQSLPYTRL